MPLTPLPTSRPPAPAVVVVPKDSPSAPRTRRERPRTAKADGSGSGVRTVRKPERLPVKAKQSNPKGHAPQPKAKPRRVGTSKAAVPQRSRPGVAPGAGRISMTELCRSSHGVTSPAITQLCHGTYR
ncbi:hypothetical protein [Streptomyces sp. NBC_00347]|uniref:hypothetical protein n=1 Tax=Streptomyces sp. NBC_00347 TaxID=2975721 RepID=UPI0022596F03|nr:hypothetical protein [Streptomyces sp. NBC_00347]MCX5128286.1 hypothetical protein [Streptomyces sp. NBC_00347]